MLSKNPADLEKCDRLIFPGVGEAKYAMEQLKLTGFDTFLRDWAQAGKPLVGICLGSQIIFEHSEEGDAQCLGLVEGEIKHFYTIEPKMKEDKIKVPHMGWNNITFENGDCPILAGIKNDSDVYFVHSFVICPNDRSVVKASAEYGIKVPNMVGKDVNDAKNELINIGLKPVVIGNGKTIVSQVPGANSNSTKDSSVFLYTE